MNLKNELAQFYGTEHYYKHMFGGMVYTDGVKYFAENAGGGAYWFLDIIATEVMQLHKTQPFNSIHLISGGHNATLTVDDGNDNKLWSKIIHITDCPEGDWQFYLIDKVLMLPSEY